MKINKPFMPVICFYYSNKDLKEEIYFRGIIRMLRDKKIFFLIKNILTSIIRFKVQ